MNLRTYKHKNNTDVAMKVIGVKRSGDGWRVIVNFINIVNPQNHFFVSSNGMFPDKCVHWVSDAQVPNWEPFNATV